MKSKLLLLIAALLLGVGSARAQINQQYQAAEEFAKEFVGGILELKFDDADIKNRVSETCWRDNAKFWTRYNEFRTKYSSSGVNYTFLVEPEKRRINRRQRESDRFALLFLVEIPQTILVDYQGAIRYDINCMFTHEATEIIVKQQTDGGWEIEGFTTGPLDAM